MNLITNLKDKKQFKILYLSNFIEEKSAVSVPVMQMGYKENIDNRTLSDKSIGNRVREKAEGCKMEA